MNTPPPLTAREVCQLLRDVVLGIRTMIRANSQSWNEIYHDLMPIEIDGSLLAFQ